MNKRTGGGLRRRRRIMRAEYLRPDSYFLISILTVRFFLDRFPRPRALCLPHNANYIIYKRHRNNRQRPLVGVGRILQPHFNILRNHGIVHSCSFRSTSLDSFKSIMMLFVCETFWLLDYDLYLSSYLVYPRPLHSLFSLFSN